jgi:hypothetical protein
MRLLILSLLLLASPVSAYIQVAQGDLVYMNETLDISLAVAYPDFQVAWCDPKNYDCDPPDQVIDITGNMHKYWLDPSVWKYGTYYRWDGEWHRAENSVAFKILPGTRPTKKINQTVNKTEVQIVQHEGPYEYLIARGDTPTVYTVLNRSDSCQLWIFSDSTNTYDLALTSSNDTYSRTFAKSDTLSMSVGEYDGYIQCNGNNGFQDIFYINNELDTPYDDKIVPDVPVISWNLLNVKRQFDQLASDIPRFDDKLIPIKVRVVEPTTTIINVEQDEHKLYITGSTSWSNDTPITLRLDPDNYVLPKDIALHTWTTFANGPIDAPRTFVTALDLDKEQLFVGVHEIASTVESKGDIAMSSFTFRISDVMVMPTPTPVAKRMIYGKDWEEIPVKVTPTPEPIVTETTVEVTMVIPTVNVTVNATPNATVKATAVPTANQTIPTIPVGIEIVLVAVSTAVVLRREL